jgi:hypothetical protein
LALDDERNALKIVTIPPIALLTTAGAVLAALCTGLGAPMTTQTNCLTADRAEYYLAIARNKGIDIVDRKTASSSVGSAASSASRWFRSR